MKFTKIMLNISLSLSLCTVWLSAQNLDDEYVELANALRDEGNKEKAIIYYQKALEANPCHFVAQFNLANVFYGQDKIKQAIDNYEKVVTLKSDCAPAHFNLGICYVRENQHEKAIKALEQTIKANPQHQKAYQQLVSLLCKQNKHKEAFDYAKKALEFDPNEFEMIYKMGQIYRHMDKFEESIPYFRRAVAVNPKHIHVILDLANMLNMTEQTDEAIQWYKKILEINPKVNEALYNLGFTLKKQGHLTEAMEIYHKLIELKPDYAQPHFSLSLSYLTLGDFENGWKQYEWRWAAYNETPRKLAKPTWQGEDLQGKTIFLYAEQGLGDTFQFIRYAKLLKDRGATVIFEAQKPLKQILSLCPYIDKVITGSDSIPAYDYQIALMSLPLIFKTTLDTVPAEIPYLYADQNLVQQWKQKLSADTNFKIGICWQGNSQYSTQFLRKAVAAKSLHVSEFEPLAKLNGISLYSLQKINGTDQIKELNINIRTFDQDFDEKNGRFMDTAAVIKNLDLVITIDTSISHFAASLGVPTWILLPEPADWRWMLKRTDTPWYPNIRLFRQPKVGDWKSTIQDVITALLELMGQQNNQSQNNTKPASNALSSQDLAELIDKLTLMEITQDENPIFRNGNLARQELLQSYMQKYAGLEIYCQQLLELNKQLKNIDTKLLKSSHSVFDEKFMELSHDAQMLQSLKSYIKKKINELEHNKK